MKIIILALLILMPFNAVVAAEQGVISTGKITEFHPAGGENSVYFKLDNNEISSNRFYYFTGPDNPGVSGGCTKYVNDIQYQALLSVIMLAYSQNKTVEVKFCKDNNGYGLVSAVSGGHIKLTNN